MKIKTAEGTEGQSIVNILKDFVKGLNSSNAPGTAITLKTYITELEKKVKKPEGGKKSSGGSKKKYKVADVQRLINRLLEAKDSKTRIKADGAWGKGTQKAYEEVMDLYYPEGKGKSWKSIAKSVGKKGSITGMFNWLVGFKMARTIQKGAKNIVSGGEANLENLINILSANGRNQQGVPMLTKQAKKLMKIGKSGDKEKFISVLYLWVVGNKNYKGSRIDDIKRGVLKSLMKIFHPGEKPESRSFFGDSNLYRSLNETFSRGYLYRQRYGRY